MYSEEIREQLEKENIETGDRIEANGYEGRLMPKPESGDPEALVLKLDSGYNIGVKPEEIELVEKQDSGEPEKPGIQHSEDKPDILVLHTGGTIASRVSYEEGGVKPAFDPEDLVQMYPELSEEVNIHSEVIAQMLSEDMEPDHWQKIARKIEEVQKDYDGIVVGHGTDTMAYTGAALTLMLQGLDTGVLLVGAQRSSDRPSTDATVNLYSAAKFLTETGFSGIGICMHETSDDKNCIIIPGAKARKNHTSRRDAFKPINSEPLGKVNYQTGEITENFRENNENFELKDKIQEKVEYLKVRPGMTVREIEDVIERDPEGVIIEGTGLGHMPVDAFDERTEHHEEMLEKIDELAESSVVVMASQCINGRIDMDVYEAGLKIKEAGVIEARDMHPELAYVKLMWSLGQADSREEAEKLFQTNVNGEIAERSKYNG